MSRGPLNRVVGALGFAALLPTALMSTTGHLTTTDTALRAGATLALVMVLRKLAGWYLAITAAAFERQAGDEHDTQAEEPLADPVVTSEPHGRERRRNEPPPAVTAVE